MFFWVWGRSEEIPPSGFSLDEIKKLNEDGMLSDEEYQRAADSINKAQTKPPPKKGVSKDRGL